MSFFETAEFAYSDGLLPIRPHFLIFPSQTVTMTGDQYSNTLVLGGPSHLHCHTVLFQSPVALKFSIREGISQGRHGDA